MGKKYTVNYHPSPSKLTSRVHPLIFLWTPRRFIFPEYFSKSFSNLHIYPTNHGCRKQASQRGGRGAWTPTFSETVLCQEYFLGNLFLCHSPRHPKLFFGSGIPKILSGALEKFQIYGFKITERDICEPKNWIFSFLLIPPSKTLPQTEGNYPFHQNSIFWKSLPPKQKGGRIMELKKWPKLNSW